MRHKEHQALDRILLGKEFAHVHEWMDEPARWLGPRHRILRHSALELLLKYGVSDEFVAGLLHLEADKVSSALKKSARRGLKHGK
jgi:hypothetical protein